MSLLSTLSESLLKELSNGTKSTTQSITINDQVFSVTFELTVLSETLKLIQFKADNLNLTLSDIANLTALTGTESISLPDQIPVLSDISIEEISLTFDTSEKSLQQVSLQIGSSTTWTIVPDLFVIEQISLDFEVENPLNNESRTISTTLTGVIQAWEATFNASITNSLGIQADLANGVTLDLDKLLDPHMENHKTGGLTISSMSLAIDPASKSYQASCIIQDFSLIPLKGLQFLSLSQVGVDLQHDASSTSCQIGGTMTIAGIDMMLSANIPDWQLTGEAAMDTPIPMGQWIQDLANDFGTSTDLPEALSSLELSDISFSYQVNPTTITFSTTIDYTLEDDKTVDLDLDIDLERNEQGKYDRDITGKLTIGDAALVVSLDKEGQDSDLEFSWDASDGGAFTVSDILDWFDSDLGKDIPSGIDLGLSEAKLTYSKEESTTSVTISATFSGGEQVFLFGTKAEGKWSMALGLGINSDQADAIDADLKKGVEHLQMDEPTLTLLLSDISQAEFKAPEALEAVVPGIDALKVGKGLYLVAGIPIKGVFDFIRSKVGSVFPEIGSDADVLLAVGFTDAQNKTGLTIEFEFPGPITFGKNILTIEDILFRFSITDSGDSPNILLALSGKSSIDTKHLADGFFQKAHLFEGDQVDILVGADIDLGMTGLDLEFRGVINAESHGHDVALLHILPGLWIGGLEFLIGIGGDEDSTIIGIGAETKVSPMDQPPTFDPPVPGSKNAFTEGRSFLIVCELDAEFIPVPIYLSLQESNMDNVNTMMTLFTGIDINKLPNDLKVAWDLISDVLNVTMFGILDIQNLWIYYADPQATKELVLPDGTRPHKKGIGIQGTAKVVELFETYVYLAFQDIPVPGAIPTGITFESVIKEMSFGPFTLDAPTGKGAAFPNYQPGSGTMGSIENFQKGVTVTEGTGNSPFIALSEDKLSLEAALQVVVGELRKAGDGGLDIGGAINIDLKSKDPEFAAAFHVQIDLLKIMDNIVESLLDGLGGLGDILKAIVVPVIKALEDILDPSIDFDTAIKIQGVEDFEFAFHIYEIGLNEEFKLSNLDFGISIKCDPEEWVKNLAETVGSHLWEWFKDDFVDKFLGAIGKAIAAAVEAVAKVFAAVAAQEWDAIKEIVEGMGDALLDIFSGNFGDLGHDFAEIGEGIATACGFGTSYSNQQVKAPYQGVYLAPGAQVALSLFENYSIAQHHVFFFDSTKDVSYQGPQLMGTISSYDVTRAKSEQQRFVAMKENLGLKRQPETPTFIQKVVGRRVELVQTDNNGNVLKDKNGNTIKLIPTAVTFDMIPGRYDSLNDSQNLSYPYSAPTAGLTLSDSPNASGIQVDDGDAAHWYIMPGLFNDDNEDYYSIVFSSVETEADIKAEQQKVTDAINGYIAQYKAAGKNDADAKAAAQAQYQKEQQPTVAINSQMASKNAETTEYEDIVKKLGDAYDYETEEDRIAAAEKVYGKIDAVMIGNAQTITTNVSGTNETYSVPEDILMTPQFIKSQGLDQFRASLDGFYLTLGESGLVARRIANANMAASKNNAPDSYHGMSDNGGFVSGDHLLRHATFDLDEVKNDQGESVAFALRTHFSGTMWVGKDFKFVTSIDEALCFAPTFFDQPPVQRVKQLLEDEFSSSCMWDGKVNAMIKNDSQFPLIIAKAINKTGLEKSSPAFTNVKTVAPNTSQLYEGDGSSNVFAIMGGSVGTEIVGIYLANNADGATIIITDDMVNKPYQFETFQFNENGDHFIYLDGEALGATQADFYSGFQIDVVNKQGTDYELWLGQADGSFVSANYKVPAHSYSTCRIVPGNGLYVSNVLVFKKAGSEEIMAAYQLKSNTASKYINGLRLVLDPTEPLEIIGNAGITAIEAADFCRVQPSAMAFEINVYNQTSNPLEVWFSDKNGCFVPDGKLTLSNLEKFTSVKPPQSNQWNLIAIVNPAASAFIGAYQIDVKDQVAKLVITELEPLTLATSGATSLEAGDFAAKIPDQSSYQVTFINRTGKALTVLPATKYGYYSEQGAINLTTSEIPVAWQMVNGYNIFTIKDPSTDEYVGLYQVSGDHAIVIVDGDAALKVELIGPSTDIRQLAGSNVLSSPVGLVYGDQEVNFINATSVPLEIFGVTSKVRLKQLSGENFYSQGKVLGSTVIEPNAYVTIKGQRGNDQTSLEFLLVRLATTKSIVGYYHFFGTKARIIHNNEEALTITNEDGPFNNQFTLVKPEHAPKPQKIDYRQFSSPVNFYNVSETHLSISGVKEDGSLFALDQNNKDSNTWDAPVAPFEFMAIGATCESIPNWLLLGDAGVNGEHSANPKPTLLIHIDVPDGKVCRLVTNDTTTIDLKMYQGAFETVPCDYYSEINLSSLAIDELTMVATNIGIMLPSAPRPNSFRFVTNGAITNQELSIQKVRDYFEDDAKYEFRKVLHAHKKNKHVWIVTQKDNSNNSILIKTDGTSILGHLDVPFDYKHNFQVDDLDNLYTFPNNSVRLYNSDSKGGQKLSVPFGIWSSVMKLSSDYKTSLNTTVLQDGTLVVRDGTIFIMKRTPEGWDHHFQIDKNANGKPVQLISNDIWKDENLFGESFYFELFFGLDISHVYLRMYHSYKNSSNDSTEQQQRYLVQYDGAELKAIYHDEKKEFFWSGSYDRPYCLDGNSGLYWARPVGRKNNQGMYERAFRISYLNMNTGRMEVKTSDIPITSNGWYGTVNQLLKDYTADEETLYLVSDLGQYHKVILNKTSYGPDHGDYPKQW